MRLHEPSPKRARVTSKEKVSEGGALRTPRRAVDSAASVAFFGHAVGETNEDLQASIADATVFHGPGILVPTRNTGLFRWCLENGLRVVQPMTLMTMGLYNEPAGTYLPSVLA